MKHDQQQRFSHCDLNLVKFKQEAFIFFYRGSLLQVNTEKSTMHTAKS